MNQYEKVRRLLDCGSTSKYAKRITGELHYASNLSTALGGKYDALVESVADQLLLVLNEEGTITRSAAMEAETMLLPMQKDAKAYRLHCVAHAHIDMNWMWGYQETVSVTVDTFRTILNLMKEYPDFTFAQSQASTYEILEKFTPAMLDEVRQRVKEGRWEVSASTWVETDKNMPSGESLARHILYTKRYLSKLLDLDPTTLNLDFEPDTFGHNISVPQICAAGGVRYYYHCRGNADDTADVYRWRGRDGSELLVYREPHWYNAGVGEDDFWDTPLFCAKHGIDCRLFVYGVGDHGGGPTRRDLEHIMEMSTWPIMPTLIFSTYGKFFAELEIFRDHLKIHEGEFNCLFNGCYTSESRVKMANHIAEDRMYESEVLGSAAAMVGGEDFRTIFRKAWKNILFNQFHDILPGSGVVDTREYALGRFQESMAAVLTGANCSMRSLAKAIDTTSIPLEREDGTVSEGAGVGMHVSQGDHYGLPCAERGCGKRRLFHLFNTTQYDFDGVVELTVFDWNYDVNRAFFQTSEGIPAESKVLDGGNHYWGHTFRKFALAAKVEAFGYASYVLDERPMEGNHLAPLPYERADNYTDDDIILENGKLVARFCHSTMELLSLHSKTDGKELVKGPSAYFRLITESTTRYMTAWRVGDYMQVQNLNETCAVRVSDVNLGGVSQWIVYELNFATKSKLRVKVKLAENSDTLEFETMADFHETGSFERGIPQLNFTLPLGYASNLCRYDVPMGTIDRAPLDYDVPANSFAAALPNDDNGALLMLHSDSKYGFRFARNALSLTLIRGSFDPDPYPEYGVHDIRIGVSICQSGDRALLGKAASDFVHRIAVCTADLADRGGILPLHARLLTLDGRVRVSAIKRAEDVDGLVIRLSETEGNEAPLTLTFARSPKEAWYTDINENRLEEIPIAENAISCKVSPYGIRTILVTFD